MQKIWEKLAIKVKLYALLFWLLHKYTNTLNDETSVDKVSTLRRMPYFLTFFAFLWHILTIISDNFLKINLIIIGNSTEYASTLNHTLFTMVGEKCSKMQLFRVIQYDQGLKQFFKLSRDICLTLTFVGIGFKLLKNNYKLTECTFSRYKTLVWKK